MEIVNKTTYYMKVMSAYVVNTSSDNDPLKESRVQIYIPEIQEYLNYSNYDGTTDSEKYPWAYNTISDLSKGDLVYVSNLSNDTTSYVILARDVRYSSSSTGGVGGSEIDGASLAELLIPFLIHEECGYGTPPLYNQYWDDNISGPCGVYTISTSASWSIGLFNWDASRAYNLIFSIAQQDSNWLSNFSSSVQDCDFCNGLKSDVAKGSASSSHYNLGRTSNTSIQEGIKKMASSSTGQIVQRNLARKDGNRYIQSIMEDYGVTNPAVLIYVGDIVNQYGSVPPKTADKIKDLSSLASSYSSKISSELNSYENPSQMMTEVEALHYWWCHVGHTYSPNANNDANGYYARRSRCIAYVRELYKQGKIASFGAGLTKIGNFYQCTYNGITLSYPFQTSEIVTRTVSLSDYTGKKSYTLNMPKEYSITSLFGTRMLNGLRSDHGGIDFGCPLNTVMYASHDGKLHILDQGGDKGFGYYARIDFTNGSDNWSIYYGHLNRYTCKEYGYELNKVYDIRAGQPIGKSDDTGNSFGNHLHFELRRNGVHINPLPYLGLGDEHHTILSDISATHLLK